jgi:hypothetical protein
MPASGKLWVQTHGESRWQIALKLCARIHVEPETSGPAPGDRSSKDRSQFIRVLLECIKEAGIDVNSSVLVVGGMQEDAEVLRRCGFHRITLSNISGVKGLFVPGGICSSLVCRYWEFNADEKELAYRKQTKIGLITGLIGAKNFLRILHGSQNMVPLLRRQGNKFFCCIQKTDDLRPWLNRESMDRLSSTGARSHHSRREDREVLRAAQPESHPGHLRHRPLHRPRRDRCPARPLRLRQIDHAAHVDRPLHAHLRPGLLAREAHRRRGDQRLHRFSELCPFSLAHGAGKR